MSNILQKGLPRTVTVGGVEVPIETDFRAGMRFETMLYTPGIAPQARIVQALLLFFGENVPRDVAGAYEAALWFFGGGDMEKAKAKAGAKRKPRRVIDYDGDAALLYSAFLDQYGVDLQDVERLHWWRFRAMLAGLREDHRIVKIMGYRAADVGAIKNKEQRRHMLEMQRRYAIRVKREGARPVDVAGAVFG